MKNLFSVFLVAVITFSSSFTLESKSSSSSAIISNFHNKVQSKKFQTGAWKVASVNKVLESGDSIRTGSFSRAEVKYTDGSVSRLGSNSLMKIEVQNEKRSNLKLLVGKLWLKVSKGNGKLTISTPTAVASVLGTELLVMNDEKNVSHVTTLDGLVEVTGNNGDKTLVKPGEWVEISPNKNMEKPTKFDWAALKRNEKFMLDPNFIPTPEEFKEDSNWK